MATNPHLGVWDIDAAEFPEQARPKAKLRFLLRYAILAPSSHNTQPWLFTIREAGVDLRMDRSRDLPATDPHGRQMVIGCGCALHHLCVAMRHFGHEPELFLFPDGNDPDFLARIEMGETIFPPDENEGLFDAIPKRRTNRQEFRDAPLPPELAEQLAKAASTYGCRAHFCHDEFERIKVAGLIAAGDKLQWADQTYRQELSAWTHASDEPISDGIPNYALNHADLLATAGPRMIRSLDLGESQAARDSDIAQSSPGLLVISTKQDDVTNWLATGQALSHILLLARRHHLSASFLNQPIETESLRPLLARTIGGEDLPQLILRLGYGPHTNPTPRRTVDEVTL